MIFLLFWASYLYSIVMIDPEKCNSWIPNAMITVSVPPYSILLISHSRFQNFWARVAVVSRSGFTKRIAEIHPEINRKLVLSPSTRISVPVFHILAQQNSILISDPSLQCCSRWERRRTFASPFNFPSDSGSLQNDASATHFGQLTSVPEWPFFGFSGFFDWQVRIVDLWPIVVRVCSHSLFSCECHLEQAGRRQDIPVGPSELTGLGDEIAPCSNNILTAKLRIRDPISCQQTRKGIKTSRK
jgi:hypothetical protein